MEHVHRTRRNLPHWYRKDSSAIYWITFRLSDSLPNEKLELIKRERARFYLDHPKPWNERTRELHRKRFTQRIEAWLDAGEGSCVLAEPSLRQHLVDALLKFDGARHDLIAAVIMPNHAHLLLNLRAGVDLGKLLKGIKGTSAREINRATGQSGRLWMEESYDHLVRSREELGKFVQYIRENSLGLSAERYWHEERELQGRLVSDPLVETLRMMQEKTEDLGL